MTENCAWHLISLIYRISPVIQFYSLLSYTTCYRLIDQLHICLHPVITLWNYSVVLSQKQAADRAETSLISQEGPTLFDGNLYLFHVFLDVCESEEGSISTLLRESLKASSSEGKSQLVFTRPHLGRQHACVEEMSKYREEM